MTNPIFQMSADSRLLYQHLKTATVGQTILYTDLSAVISKPVSGASPCLHTAIRRCQNSHEMVFASVRGVGVKRLTDTEIVDESVSLTAQVRRKAKKAANRLMLVNDFSGLPERQKQQHMARASILASVAHITTERQVDRFITAAAGSSAKELPVSETLKMFA